LIYLTQQTVKTLVQKHGIPVVKSRCPVNGRTKREDMKELVGSLVELFPELKTRFLSALQTLDPQNMWPPMVCRNMRDLHAREKDGNETPGEGS